MGVMAIVNQLMSSRCSRLSLLDLSHNAVEVPLLPDLCRTRQEFGSLSSLRNVALCVVSILWAMTCTTSLQSSLSCR